jgi:hypothetical protein
MLIWSVLPWAGLTLGIILTVVACVRFEEIGRMVGTGAGAIICNVVFLVGINGTALGALLFVGGVVLALMSTYLFERERKRRCKQGP